MSGTNGDAKLIAQLNDLLQLDHDAVEAYTIAIDRIRDAHHRESLVGFRADHKRHIEELAGLVRGRGGLPTELPHPTGALKLAVQAGGALGNDVSLLLAFKAVEGQVRDKYRRAARQSMPPDATEVVARAADDEERHYAWAEQTLREMGVGAGTVPHGVASALEQVHKLLADPMERAEREVMRRVGEVVGTTRSRGGAEAPLPMDAAATSDRAGGTMGTSADTQRFMQALRALEEANDLEGMVALFDSTSEISNPLDAAPHHGQEGARHFWQTYRNSFDQIRSDFSRVVESDGAAMIEWTSHGVMRGDHPIDYSGVSVLELRGGKVRRFRAYFDTKPFELPVPHDDQGA